MEERKHGEVDFSPSREIRGGGGRELPIRGRALLVSFIALFALIFGMAGIPVAAQAAGTIPNDKITVTFENESGTPGETSAWDSFKFTVKLADLDGLPAGTTATVALDPDRFEGFPNSTIYLNDDGTSSPTQSEKTVAKMDVVGSTRTMTFTLTDYAETHTKVNAEGWIRAQINADFERNETVPIKTWINGEVKEIGKVTGKDCTDDCPTVPTHPSKWGGDNGDGTGTVTIRTQIFEDASEGVNVKDELVSGSQEIVGVRSVRAYNCVDGWGSPGVTVSGKCDPYNASLNVSYDENATGDYTLKSTDPNVFFHLILDMKFTGPGPWVDKATVTSTGGDSQETMTTVKKFEIGGGGSGELPPGEEVTPVEPTVTDAVCKAPGDLTQPSVTVPADTDQISYTKSGDEVPGGTVIVTATAKDGFFFNEGATNAGWTVADDYLSATKTITLKDVPCELTEVAPVAPVVTDAVCKAPGDLTKPSVTPAKTEGIEYTVSGEAKPGSTVTVTAKAKPGYKLTAADGWTLNPDGTATLVVTLKDVPCAPATPKLPDTGANGTVVLALGSLALLVAGGTIAYFAARRRTVS